MTTIHLGGLDVSQFLAENAALPFLEDLPVVAFVREAIDQAITERRAVLVAGPKGSGKTEAKRLVLEELEADETAKAAADGAYVPRVACELFAPREEEYDRALIALFRAIMPTPPVLTVRGRRKIDEELRYEFIDKCLAQNRALIIVEELERASDAFITVLRDVVADAEARDPNRVVQVAGGGRAIRPAGIGVVALGDVSQKARLLLGGAASEAGQRWIRCLDVPPLSLADSAAIYRRWFPGFTAGIAARGGASWWDAFVGTTLLEGRPRSLREIENAGRLYLRFAVHADPAITTLAQVSLDEKLFCLAWQQAQWASPSAGGVARGGSQAPPPAPEA